MTHHAVHCQARQLRQNGSVLVQFALLLGVLVAILGLVDIGYMYYSKRDLQRIADQAAIDAVQNIEYSTNPSNKRCQDAGEASINTNWPIAVTRDTQETKVRCGNWNPAQNPAPRYFSETGERNAAHVTVQGTTPTILPGTWSRTIFAEAVAKREEPLAVFSVATTLVNVGCAQQLAPLVQILKIVGVGDPCVSVGGYQGLVGAQISASGLLKALGIPLDANLSVADLNNLLMAKKVKLGDLLDTALTLGGHTELLDLNAKVLSLLKAQLGIDALAMEIPLGSGPDGPGVFASIYAPDGTKGSALDVQLNVLDIVTAAVGVGTSGRGVSIPNLSVAIPGILPNLLQVKAGIIEPPSIGIGSIGATAYNAQVRLYADIDTAGGLVGGLLQLLQTRIKLPVFVDVARAKGTIDDITCRVPGTASTARIRVDASIAQACIGQTTGNPFSTRTPICESLQNETLVSVLGLIKVTNKVKIDALTDSYLSPDLKAGDPAWRTPGNSLNLGTMLSSLVSELLRLVGELLGAPTGGEWTAAESQDAATKMANHYLGIGPNAQAPLSTVNLGLHVPAVKGAYDTDALVDRLSKGIDRTGQGCLLGIPLLCWSTNGWKTWGDSVGDVLPGLPNYIGSGSCHQVGLTNVTTYNNCVRDKLAEELLKKPADKPKNFLQVLLDPLLVVLKSILDPLGNLLAGPILRDLLGIELGLNDVTVTSVGCGNARLVY
ncbi:pilus assembly protein TadG-related protein [Comamonas sp. J-3]|uniref:pilus assembly protein TadG-related protein n=1 Tax=Comamonas trifloxystrobinivorans TaxID=3350256 RepID=UPI00372B5816